MGVKTLIELANDPVQQDEIATDAVDEVARLVGEMSGPSGVAARAGMSAVNRLRPGFLHSNVVRMMPQFATAIQPSVDAGEASGDLVGYFNQHKEVIANDLLSVTDARVAQAKNKPAIAVYNKLRKHAPKRVATYVPEVGAFIETKVNPRRATA